MRVELGWRADMRRLMLQLVDGCDVRRKDKCKATDAGTEDDRSDGVCDSIGFGSRAVVWCVGMEWRNERSEVNVQTRSRPMPTLQATKLRVL